MNLVEARRAIGQRRRIVGSRVRTNDYYGFRGGLNQVDSVLEIEPGQALGALNYETYYEGGYRRLDGYERLDGQLAPSEADYTAIDFVAGDLAAYPAVGDTVDGVTSAAQGVLLALVRRNIHPDSEALGLWSSNFGVTVQSDVYSAPTGAATGDKLIEGGSNEPLTGLAIIPWLPHFEVDWEGAGGGEVEVFGEHYARHSFDLEAGTWTASVHLRPAERTVAVFRVRQVASGVLLADSYVDLLTGQVIPRTGGAAAVVTIQKGLGWWRVYSTVSAAAGAVEVSVFIALEVGGPATSLAYTGDGASGFGVWGMQMAAGALSDYVRTSGGESGSIYLGRVTGTFEDGETLEGADPFAVETGNPFQNVAPEDEHWNYVLLAHEDARALILKPPGEGACLGAIQFNDHAYAFRNKVGGASAGMYRSSASGWEEVDLGRKLRFDEGQVEIKEGDVITGGSSGATATVKRVGIKDGVFGGSPLASGYLIFSSVTGGPFVDNEDLEVFAVVVAKADGADFAQTLQPGGTYEFRIDNFGGHLKSRRLYGVSGVDYAFEYDDDEDVFCQIETNMVEDKPAHLAIHQLHLWLAFRGGSLQFSSQGLPREWQVLTGAAELGMGDEITGLLEEVGDTLFVFSRNKVKYVTGSTSLDFALKNFSTESGGIERTLQRIGQGIVLDDRGFTSLATTDRFGNYVANSFSYKAEKLVRELRRVGAVASVISRSLNLYRCFFADGRMLSIGVNGTDVVGIMPCQLPAIVHAATSSEDENGHEVILLAAEDGFVYHMDPPRPALSFDGVEIEYACRSVFHHSRDPSRFKRYRRAQIDIETETPVDLQVSVDYSFSGPNAESEVLNRIHVDGGGGFWDVSLWDNFRWDIGPTQFAIIDLNGSGTNLGLIIYGKSAREGSHRLSGVSFNESPRRINRGAEA